MIQRGKGHAPKETEMAVMQLLVKECQCWQQVTRIQKRIQEGFFPKAPAEQHGPADTLILDSEPPGM